MSRASLVEGYDIGRNVQSLTQQLKRDLSQPLFKKSTKEERQLLYLDGRHSSFSSEDEEQKRKEYDVHGRSYKEIAHRVM
jgi:hypothetical protein